MLALGAFRFGMVHAPKSLTTLNLLDFLRALVLASTKCTYIVHFQALPPTERTHSGHSARRSRMGQSGRSSP
jgi:hypothetical protein